jgi:hypothetical protein
MEDESTYRKKEGMEKWGRANGREVSKEWTYIASERSERGTGETPEYKISGMGMYHNLHNKKG